MQLVSFKFLAFLFATIFIYFIFPRKIRYIWLLAASIGFYYVVSGKLVALLLIECAIAYLVGLVAAEKEGRSIYLREGVLACGVASLVLILALFKYLGFLLETVKKIQYLLGLSESEIVLNLIIPLGISFYTFQAIGYMVDCYRGTVPAEKNPLKVILFISFFLQITSGPIERAGNMLPQYTDPKRFSYDSMREGLLLMLWGYFQKIIIADRLTIMVDSVFSSYEEMPGTLLFIGTILYTMEIYTDFAGYSNIVVGAAKIMGIELMQNFKYPYLSGSIAEFWRRWHISLSSWLRDYLYIPLGGNRKGYVRKLINIFIVFAVSGLWHGAAWRFVVWGILHGMYQIIGSILMPVRDKLVQITWRNRNSLSHRVFKVAVTFMLVNIGWIFFRAPSFDVAIYFLKNMWSFTPWVITQGELFDLGLGRLDVMLLIYALALHIGVDIMNSKGIVVREVITRQSIWLRWLVYLVSLGFVVTCGIWGPGYDAASFIYSSF
jgi:D-alanyl-lipoteichoic acid acyltransferase DltB (MBOAT superfamily)